MHPVADGDFEAMQESKYSLGEGDVLFIENDRRCQVVACGCQIPFEAFSADGAFDRFESFWRMGHRLSGTFAIVAIVRAIAHHFVL
jgi:hypothetical protein